MRTTCAFSASSNLWQLDKATRRHQHTWECLGVRSHVLCLPIILLALTGCATIGIRPDTPAWWLDPQQHGPRHLYFKAKGESNESLEDARQNALRSIQAQIAKYIFAEVRVSETDNNTAHTSIESAIEVREVEAFKEDQARSGSRWVVWMLGRYPRSEYDRIRQRLEIGVELDEQWRKAQSAANRQQTTEAERALLGIIQSYDKALRTSFELEAVKLELAALYLKQNRGLKARQWIADVQKTTVQTEWRKRADVLASQLPPVSLRDAFEGQSVGIYCCTRKDGQLSMNLDLIQELTARLAKDGIQTVAVRELVQTGRNAIDDSAIKRIAATVHNQKADVLLLVLCDIDSTKTGKKVDIPGSTAQTGAYDARLTYWVIRTLNSRVLASDSTVGFSGTPAGMLNIILTHRRHLPGYAPAIAEGLSSR